MDKAIFSYHSTETEGTHKIQIEVDSEVNLTKMFAYFIDFTRLMGYQEGSWADVIKNYQNETGNLFGAFSWADSIIYEE